MANSIAAVLPQFWAMEGLRRLMELTPAVNSVNRQFASDLASAGDTVNAWRADRRLVRVARVDNPNALVKCFNNL